jgi:hypothetical protein
MLTIDCPWCDGPATIQAEPADDAFTCEACSIRVDLAAMPAEDVVALAA